MYCLCVNVYCHWVTTQLQFINISCHISECKSCFFLFHPHHILRMSECISQLMCPVSLSAPHHCVCLFSMRGLSIYACCVKDTGSCGIWRRVTWCFLAFRGNAMLASTFEGSNKGSPFLRNVCKHSVTSQKHWIRDIYYLLLMWTVWDMKPRNTTFLISIHKEH